jgi:hypothetical protein
MSPWEIPILILCLFILQCCVGVNLVAKAFYRYFFRCAKLILYLNFIKTDYCKQTHAKHLVVRHSQKHS